MTFAGKRIAGKGPIPSETPIHAAVYRSRPDVESVIHCHARYSILVGLLDSGLIPFNREARLFADGVPIFPESHGINSFTLAQRMVDALGQHYAVFLRGHGVVVAGPGIEGTCISAIQLERACQDQLLMMSIAAVKPMAEAGSRAQQRSVGKSLSCLAVSFVQAQGQIESADSSRYPHARRRQALLMSSAKFFGSKALAKRGTKVRSRRRGGFGTRPARRCGFSRQIVSFCSPCSFYQ